MNSEIKYLLPYKNFYKANLHCRSTLSDGALTPERLKEIYKDKGYSVLAMTDNEPISHKALCDEDFLVLSGFRFGAVSKNTVPIKSSVFSAISQNSVSGSTTAGSSAIIRWGAWSSASAI